MNRRQRDVSQISNLSCFQTFKSTGITLLPRMSLFDGADEGLMPGTPWLDVCLEWSWMADDTRLKADYRINFSVALSSFADLEGCERLRDIDVKSCVGQKAARTDTTPKPERKRVRVRFWKTAIGGKKSFRFECHGIMVYRRIMSKEPVNK